MHRYLLGFSLTRAVFFDRSRLWLHTVTVALLLVVIILTRKHCHSVKRPKLALYVPMGLKDSYE